MLKPFFSAVISFRLFFFFVWQIEKILGRRPLKEPDPDDGDAVREG